MVPHRNPTLIFHITAIPNLAAIAASGELVSKSIVSQLGIQAADIAYQNIQGRRAGRSVPIAPNGILHDYVPFYFAPRSPMLMTINSGNVPTCPYRQDDIVHLVSNAQSIDDLGLPFVFTDLHAALDYARFFDAIEDLDEIAWDLFHENPKMDGYCQYWMSKHTPAKYAQRREIRQAEFLVHGRLPLAAITQIGVRNENMEARVRAALTGTDWQPPIVRHPSWYY
jgi:hypothetical protein